MPPIDLGVPPGKRACMRRLPPSCQAGSGGGGARGRPTRAVCAWPYPGPTAPAPVSACWPVAGWRGGTCAGAWHR